VRAVNPPLTSLCDVSMRLDDPSTCARCGVLPLMEFNPLASHMTLRKKAARSPVQFLSENRQAAEFWQMVERTGAYEGHHRSGRSHYVAFVDTLKLLSAPVLGDQLAERLARQVLARTTPPEIILAPNRLRARLLGKKIIKALAGMSEGIAPDLVLTSRRRTKRVLPDGSLRSGRSALV